MPGRPITRRAYWPGVGLGAGSEDLAAHVNGSYRFAANLISLRIASTAGLFDIERTDYALLYGRATRGVRDRHLLAAGVGVALVDGCGMEGGGFLGGCQDHSSIIGLPLEAQASSPVVRRGDARRPARPAAMRRGDSEFGRSL